ncbi:Gp15 family bacteriophage protein [Pediococcus acidilactici]|uniref:Gp15 family bacteriophage protein n=1 Tax=Pediococcus acidilactici TaxID=1254 RepID=UPI00200A8FDE|nr:Gp15 family bacteriophage protein [Pediococcus acidilactici]UPU32382.1 bacteriophage Gp15 family protein [Pediococcus acidilactici]
MISLTSGLEHSIVIGNQIVEVDFAFDTVLKWYELLEDDSINDIEKTFIGFKMFVGEPSEYDEQQIVEAMQSISAYLSQSAYGNFNDEEIEPEFEVEPEPPTKYYSYTKDAEAIYASFLFDYKIDLVDAQGVMHWDKFKALFNNLSENSPFQRIVNIRQTNPNEYKDDPKAMQKIIEAQEFYRLEDDQNVQALDMQMSSMFDMLKNQAKGG